MRRALPLLAAALLLGASAPERPTPNAPQAAGAPERVAVAGRGEGPVAETVWEDDAKLRDFIAAADWDALGGVIVQDAGRRKPLEAFARETLWKILNVQTYRGQPPVFTLLSMGFDPLWERVRALKAGHPDLVKAFELKEKDNKRISMTDLGGPVYEGLWNSVDRMGGAKSPRDRAILDLDRRGTLLKDVLSTLKVLPSPKNPEAPWIGMGEPGAAAASVPAYNAFVDMGNAYLKRDAPAFNAAALTWAAACSAAAPGDYEALAGTLQLERVYCRTQPFRWACLGYFAAFMIFLLNAWVFHRPGWKRTATGFLMASCLLHGTGIASRVAIAGRPPVSNMYEVIIYVSWAVVAASFVVEAMMRLGVAGLPASGMAALGLTAPAIFPFLDPHIGQVQAVLKSNYWLTVHVCTITSSYAILFLGFATGIYFLASRRPEIDRVAYRVNQLGFLFLTAGIMTGAWWANKSWGRYWGWDSKETGSFIIWCLYAAYLHLRLFGFLKPRGAAWLTVAGFFSILFTIVVPSFFLVGLHSYAQ